MLKSYMKKYKKDVNKQNDIDVESLAATGVNLSDININDIKDNIINNNDTKKKKSANAIEYYLFDVDSYNNKINMKNENFVDLSSLKASYLSENRKKKTKKKKGNYIKKKLNLYKKKYKILPEYNFDQDTNYEESIKSESKEYNKYYLEDIEKDKKEKEITKQNYKINFGIKNDTVLYVIKFIALISSIFSLSSFNTTISKYIINVNKFNYTQIVTFFEFLVMYIILRIYVFIWKIDSSTKLSIKDYIKYIISTSALLDINTITGNSAYFYLEIPIIAVLKSSSLIIIYFLSVYFGLKELKCSLLCSILTIFLGVAMSITTLKIDSTFGLFILSISVMASSIKWVITNILLKTTTIKPHIILMHIYQTALLIIIIPCIIIDLTSIVSDYNNNIITFEQIFKSLSLIAIGALTSIFLILTEYSIISYTSSVTLSIIFIGREAIILIIGSIFFGEKVSLSSAIGIIISMIGTVLYGYVS